MDRARATRCLAGRTATYLGATIFVISLIYFFSGILWMVAQYSKVPLDTWTPEPMISMVASRFSAITGFVAGAMLIAIGQIATYLRKILFAMGY